ncbi:hypothetical protein AAES_00677 [Amazona aestiva]|uniref:Uncharacterized protein n=1 Tax=Amazona aestiva TaxID=12930 RepID=A0A0Q3LU34_AMAAE|nr:hypothetical protein AAES_00677 [Amazona aestiva]
MKMADAKQKRNEQLKRWIGSETDLEPPVVKRKKTKVKFDDGAVFLAACSSGDTEEVLRLLERGADINYANVDGLTALHQSWRKSSVQCKNEFNWNVVVVLDNCSMSIPFWDSCNQEIVNYASLRSYSGINIEYMHIGHAVYEDMYLTKVISVLYKISFFVDLGNCKMQTGMQLQDSGAVSKLGSF